MEMKPKVSVIITTFNHEKYIAESINSVLAQTFKDFEVIVINDGSTDSTAEIIQKIVNANSEKIIFINHKENQRPCSIGNQGLAIARGEYIGWNGGDDIWYPTKLEKQMKLFTEDPEKNIGIVYCYGENLIESSTRFRSKTNAVDLEKDVFKELFRSAFFFKISMLVRKEIHSCVGNFDVSVSSLCRDYEWLLRVAATKYRFDRVPEILVGHRIHDNNETRNRAIAQQNTKEMLLNIAQKYPQLIKAKNIDVNKRLAVCDLESAQYYFVTGKRNEARRLLLNVLKKFPRTILGNKKWLAYFLLSFLSDNNIERLHKIMPTRNLFKGY